MPINYFTIPHLLVMLSVYIFLSGCNYINNENSSASRPVKETESATKGIRAGKLIGIVELAGHCGNMPQVQPDVCQAKPLSTEVAIFRQNDGKLIRRMQSDVDGHFELELKPDLYRITAKASRFMSPTTQIIRVLPGERQHVVLSLHANIP